MSDYAIQVENLGKCYRIGAAQERPDSLHEVWEGFVRRKQRPSAKTTEFWALKDVSFDVPRGDIIGVIGRNGAGKSTLLKILSRITEPTEGRAVLHGRVGSLLEVGTGFHPELTGRENVYLSGAILGMRRAEIDRQFDEIVAFAEIEKFLDTPVKRYSSGMYVRLAFAVAAHLNPEILLVDEVLAVGDAQFQKKCLGKMGDVASEGRTVLFVSHNMGAISDLCDTVVLLADGCVEDLGEASDVVGRFLADMLMPDSGTVEDFRVPGFGERARIVDIRLLSGDDGHVPFGEAVRVALVIESDIDDDALSIGASILDEAGRSIGNHFSDSSVRLRRGTTCSVELVIDSPRLAPGRYHMGFSIGHGGFFGARKDLDCIIGLPGFVVEAASSSGDVMNWNPRWGHVVIDDAKMVVSGSAGIQAPDGLCKGVAICRE